MSRRLERFASIPLRVYDAVERDELSVDEFTVLCWLAGKANYRPTPPEFVGTLALIREAIQWSKTDEALRQLLHRLEAKGWIALEVTQGQRRAFVVKLTGLACRPLGGSLEVGSSTWKSEEEAQPPPVTGSGGAETSQLGSPQIPNPNPNTNANPDRAFSNVGEGDAFFVGNGSGPRDPIAEIVAQVTDGSGGPELERKLRARYGTTPEGHLFNASEALAEAKAAGRIQKTEAGYVLGTLKQVTRGVSATDALYGGEAA